MKTSMTRTSTMRIPPKIRGSRSGSPYSVLFAKYLSLTTQCSRQCPQHYSRCTPECILRNALLTGLRPGSGRSLPRLPALNPLALPATPLQRPAVCHQSPPIVCFAHFRFQARAKRARAIVHLNRVADVRLLQARRVIDCRQRFERCTRLILGSQRELVVRVSGIEVFALIQRRSHHKLIEESVNAGPGRTRSATTCPPGNSEVLDPFPKRVASRSAIGCWLSPNSDPTCCWL